MNQYEVAYILREMGTLIALSDPMPQKGFAYLKAARAVEEMKHFARNVENARLEEVPHIGETLAKMITVLARQGTLRYYEELKQQVPAGLVELTHIPGLNAKKVRILYEKLNITTLDELKKALEDDLIVPLKLMPPAKIKRLLTTVERIQQEGYSLLYPKAFLLAQSFISFLKMMKLVKKITLTGALRRKCPVITEFNWVAISDKPTECLHLFTLHPAVKEVLNQEPLQMKVRLKNGLMAHLKLASKQDYIAHVFLDTGSKEHVKALKKQPDQPINSEELFYASLGLDYIPPELRENCGEIAAAKQHRLPQLIEESDLKGAFHCHTTDSDGIHTLEQMVAGARKLKWEYIGITDHSQSSYQANGMNEERLFDQIERIRKLNQQQTQIKVFAGLECDVLKDGELDFPQEVLKHLDFVIVSVHRYFKMEKKEMTKRIIRAIENPCTTIVGHLTGRLLLHRDPYEVDIDKIVDAAIANGKVIEINSNSHRLDMDWTYWIKAKEKGLLCSINPDAHSVQELLNCHFGIYVARKGWLEKKDVINTMNLKEMMTFLKKMRG